MNICKITSDYFFLITTTKTHTYTTKSIFQVSLLFYIHSYPWPDVVGLRLDRSESLEPTLMTIDCSQYEDLASESDHIRRSRMRAYP